ncbi:MAG: hypothetical protein AAGF95_33640 [Chloroflexota bacterium]
MRVSRYMDAAQCAGYAIKRWIVLTQWELPEGNLCLAVLPATVDADGALELWYAVKTETKVRKLLRLRGAPPIPSPTPAPTPTPRPATQWA